MSAVLIELRNDGLTTISPVGRLERYREYLGVVNGLPHDGQSASSRVTNGDRAAVVMRELGKAGFEIKIGNRLRRALGMPVEPRTKPPKSPPPKQEKAATTASIKRQPAAANKSLVRKADAKPAPPIAATDAVAAPAPPVPGSTPSVRASTPIRPPNRKHPKAPTEEEKLAIQIAKQLREPLWRLIGAVIKHAGEAQFRELVDQTLAIEAQGGMLTDDGTRRRSPGGVLFRLARERRFMPTWAEMRKQRPGRWAVLDTNKPAVFDCVEKILASAGEPLRAGEILQRSNGSIPLQTSDPSSALGQLLQEECEQHGEASRFVLVGERKKHLLYTIRTPSGAGG